MRNENIIKTYYLQFKKNKFEKDEKITFPSMYVYIEKISIYAIYTQIFTQIYIDKVLKQTQKR